MLSNRSNEIGKDPDSPQHSTYSPGGTEEPEPRVSISGPSPSSVVTSVSQTAPFYSQTVTPVPASAPDPRYTSNQFRTPKIPSSVFGQVLRSSPTSKSSFSSK